MLTRFLHLRARSEDKAVETRGGVTIAYKIDEHDQVGRWAFARCSFRDNYCKKIGRTIAEGRLNSPRQSRQIMPCSEKAFISSVTQLISQLAR